MIDSKENWSPWTKSIYKIALRKFFLWLRNKEDYPHVEEYPEEVRWIKPNIKKRDQPRIQREDILTERDFKALINTAKGPMEKAIVAVRSETGCRPGEGGNMRVRDFFLIGSDYYVRFPQSKTEPRENIIFYSVPYLKAWLNVHPLKDNPEAPMSYVDYKRWTFSTDEIWHT